MTAPGILVALALGVAVVALLVGAATLVVQRRTTRALTSALASAGSEVDRLRHRVETLERRLPAEPVTREAVAEHVITVLGEEPTHEPDPVERGRPPVPTALFADLVLREGVVQAAALAAGVRRALAPEQRHRVRLEMRREVKRARKQRRSDLRDARRVLADRARREPAA